MNSFFDALEPRVLLSAPVATVESFRLTADSMTVFVRYSADTGIDRSSIGSDDLVLTGPGLVRRPGQGQPVQSEGPDVIAYYSFSRDPQGLAHDAWPNGTYNLGVLAGAVRSADGVGNAATGVGSHWLWFPDSYVVMDWASYSSDGWIIALTRWMRHPDAQTTLTTSVRITGPHGDQVFEVQGVYGAYKNRVEIAQENATGLWNYTDTGTYSIAVGEYDGAAQLVGFRPVEQRFRWVDGARIEILSTQFSDTDVLITARFTDRAAVDLSSINWWTIEAEVGASRIHASPDHYLALDPQPDGSVIAAFRLYPGPFDSWGARENGDWRYVLTNNDHGYHTTLGILMHQWHAFTTLSTASTGMAAYAQEPRTVTFKMEFPVLNVDLATLGNDDIRLELNGRSYQLSFAYTYNSDWDWGWGLSITAAYTLTLPQGERLDTGTARIYMNAGALSISGQPSSEQFMGSWWLWFD
jgi:hypothetical protein